MSTATADFSSIPILDYSLVSSSQPGDREAFINQLRHALINVGFLYLKNHSVPQSIVDRLIGSIPKLFDLPQEAKDKIRMENSQHFLGYSRLGTELTKGQVDQREQYDFGTTHKCRWQKGDPDYYRLWGECQASIRIFATLLDLFLSVFSSGQISLDSGRRAKHTPKKSNNSATTSVLLWLKLSHLDQRV